MPDVGREWSIIKKSPELGDYLNAEIAIALIGMAIYALVLLLAGGFKFAFADNRSTKLRGKKAN